MCVGAKIVTPKGQALRGAAVITYRMVSKEGSKKTPEKIGTGSAIREVRGVVVFATGERAEIINKKYFFKKVANSNSHL
jgi:hypothetical protein